MDTQQDERELASAMLGSTLDRLAGTTTVAAVGLDAYELVELIPEPWEVTYTDLDAGVVLAERENDLAIYLDGEITVSNPRPSA